MKERIGTELSLFLIAGIPAVLILIHTIASSLYQEMYLVFANPTPQTLLLSNYAHLSTNHLIQNILMYEMIVIAIIVTEEFIIANMETDTRFRIFSEDVFITSVAIYMTAGAMTLAVISSLYYSTTSNIIGGVGFSGIVAMMGGYYVYLLRGVIIYNAFQALKRGNRGAFDIGIIISFAIPVFVAGMLVLTSIESQTNVIDHAVGFVIGVLVPYAID